MQCRLTRPVNFTGTPGLSHLGPQPAGAVVVLSELTGRLRALGVRPVAGVDLVEDIEAGALRDALEESEARRHAVEAGEKALQSRIDTLRGELEAAHKVVDDYAAQLNQMQNRAVAAEAERDALADRLSATGGDTGRPWLASEHNKARKAMVNDWRREMGFESALPRIDTADAWLYRQPDAIVAERWAAHIGGDA